MKKDILSIFCPGCGAPAEFDIVHQIYCCGYCGQTIALEDARQEKEQFKERIREKVSQEVKKYPLMTTTCSGCGATLVFEENEAVSSCDFCDRKLVREKYTKADDVPEGIIPFAVTKEEAKEKLLEWCEHNSGKAEAKHLLSHVESLQGYYLPYQMVRGPVSCDVKHVNDTTIFTGSGYVHDEMVNCSSQLDNLVLDAMEPYDLSDLKEFDFAYVAGQRVKIADIGKEDTKKRLGEEVSSNYRVFMEKIWGTKAINLKTKLDTIFRFPVLLPAYYIKSGDVSAAVNGQTGKVSVQAEKNSTYISLPWWLEGIFLFIAACALVFGISWLASKDIMNSLIITAVVGLFYFFILCFMFEPGLNNRGSIIHYRKIFTSGEESYRREKGKLVPREEMLRRKIAEPVFLKNQGGEEIQVRYVFRSWKRIFSMIALAFVGVFLPVILALFVNGFDFQRLALGGSAVWFCITVPLAPIMLVQLGLKELYRNPRIYQITENGRKKRVYADGMKPGNVVKGVLKFLFLHPLGWLALGVMAIMVYLTAFGF